MYMKYTYTYQSNFGYTFEMLALHNLIFRYVFVKKKKTTVLSYDLVDIYIYIYIFIHIYYRSNSCYTFAHHSILILKSIAKVRRLCICIWNITLHTNLSFGILSNDCLTDLIFRFFSVENNRAKLWTCYII